MQSGVGNGGGVGTLIAAVEEEDDDDNRGDPGEHDMIFGEEEEETGFRGEGRLQEIEGNSFLLSSGGIIAGRDVMEDCIGTEG